jgi:NAD(P)-dependent dehydrogenase (short-subunit alcohol dehydrogenase family)
METSLNNKVALITGASKGLGLAMAKAYYSHGAKVALLARGPEDLATAEANINAMAVTDEYRESARVKAYACDVTDAKGHSSHPPSGGSRLR